MVTKVSKMTKAEISAFMAEMGRKGGRIGGKRRLETMTAEQRSRNASLAARVRWGTAPTARAWSREAWPPGTVFQVRWPKATLFWRGCVIGRYTRSRVYFGYPPYDGVNQVARSHRLTEFQAWIAAGDIRKTG